MIATSGFLTALECTKFVSFAERGGDDTALLTALNLEEQMQSDN